MIKMLGKIHSEKLYNKIMKRLLTKPINIAAVAREFGIPRSTLSAWYHGRKPFFSLITNKALNKRRIRKLFYIFSEGRPIKNKDGTRRGTVRKFIPENAKILTPEKAYILGVICGDGYVSYKDRYVSLETITLEFIQKFQECMMKVYGRNFGGHISPTINGKQRIVICGKEMTDDIRKYLPEQGSFKWKVSEEILKSNQECKIGFLQGFFDSEGSVHRRFDLDIRSVNKEALSQIKQLLNDIGIKSSEIKPKNKTNQYTLYITGEENIIKFIFKVGTNIPSRFIKMKELVNKYGISHSRSSSMVERAAVA